MYILLQIHGDKSQMERDYVLRQFRTGKANILVATDVAARGLDVDGIHHVINFDYPGNSEDYIHRIGRTGRSDNTGTSYTFFTDNNARQAQDLINILREARQEIDPKLFEMSNRKGRNGFDKGRRFGTFGRSSSSSYRNGNGGGMQRGRPNGYNNTSKPNGNFNRNGANSRKTFD